MLQVDLQLVGDALGSAGIQLPTAQEEGLTARNGCRRTILMEKREVRAQP